MDAIAILGRRGRTRCSRPIGSRRWTAIRAWSRPELVGGGLDRWADRAPAGSRCRLERRKRRAGRGRGLIGVRHLAGQCRDPLGHDPLHRDGRRAAGRPASRCACRTDPGAGDRRGIGRSRQPSLRGVGRLRPRRFRPDPRRHRPRLGRRPRAGPCPSHRGRGPRWPVRRLLSVRHRARPRCRQRPRGRRCQLADRLPDHSGRRALGRAARAWRAPPRPAPRADPRLHPRRGPQSPTPGAWPSSSWRCSRSRSRSAPGSSTT